MTDDAIVNDNEIQCWIADINENGFQSKSDKNNFGLPKKIGSVSELADLLTKLLFTCTCKHAATHSEAMDMYGFDPKTPACMLAPPPAEKGTTKKGVLTQTLPEQDSSKYNSSVAYVMSLIKADEVCCC